MFIRNVHSFPSEVHRKLYMDGLRLTPLEVSLAHTSGVNQELVESCKQYYNFITDMLWSMYCDPKSYGFPAGELEDFIDGKKVNGVKRKFPTQVNRMRTALYNTACVYQSFLFLLGKAGNVVGDSLCLSKDSFQSIRKEFDTKLSPKKSTIYTLVPYEVRMEGFHKNGLSFLEENDVVVVTSSTYPNIFLAMKTLADSAANVKTFGEENFRACEFRQIFSKYTPKYEDVVQTLDEPQKKLCDVIHAYLLSMKAKPSCTTYWKVNYKYKGDQIVQISTEGDELKIIINGYYWWDNGQELLDNLLKKQDDAFQKYSIRNLNYCTGCSTSHEGGGFAEVLGHRVRLCGGVSFRNKNADLNQVDYLKKLIHIRAEIIEEIKKQKLYG